MSLEQTPKSATGVYFDPLSFTSFDHPYETYAQLREEAPVYFNERRSLWVLSRYEDVLECLRNHDKLVNKYGNDIDGTHDAYGVGMLVCQDPPHHTVLRYAIRPCFSSSAILAMEALIRSESKKLVAKFHEHGHIEFTNDIALPLAFAVALNLVGAPLSDAPELSEHLKRAMERIVGKLGVSADAALANEETEHRLAEVVAHRKAVLAESGDYSATDAITQILRSVKEGKLDDIEVVGLSHLVLSAATDAPAALLSNCIAVLDRFPNLQAHLAQNPHQIENFVEEVLRFESPAQNLSRQTAESFEIGGVTIPANSRVMLLLASANRDGSVFENPDRFDVARDFSGKAKVLAFGDGIHSCMGAPIARLTAKVFLEELLDGHEYRIEGTPERWVKQMVRGFSRLPLSVITTPDAPLIGAETHHENKMALTGHRHLQETEVVISSKRQAADGVVELILKNPNGDSLPTWQPGAHIDLVLGAAPTRQYSLCSDPSDTSSYRIGVLLEPASRGGSSFIHNQLNEGDLVTVKGPRNNFHLKPAKRYIFVAGGIGITPLLPMIAEVSKGQADWELYYVGKTARTMAFRDELAKYGDRVRVLPKDEFGRLDLNGLLGEALEDTLVYSCGPESLLDALDDAMAHWPAGSLCTERFSPKTLGEPLRRTSFEVELARSGQVVEVSPGMSILDAVTEAGVEVLSSCGQGTCGTCETRVLAGKPDHRDSILDAVAQQQGDTMMICVSRSCSDRLTLDL